MRILDVFRGASAPRNQATTSVAIRAVNSEELHRAIAGDSYVGLVPVNQYTSMAIPAVFRAVGLLSNITAGLPFTVVRSNDDGSRQPLPDHPITVAMTRNPNRYQSGYEFRRTMQANLLLRGDAFARIIRPVRANGPWEFLPFKPGEITPELVESERVIRYKLAGSGRFLASSEVFHLRGISFDGVTGLSPIALARQTFGNALQSQRASERIMTQGTFSNFGLKHPGKLKTGAIENIRKSFVDMFGGSENSGIPPIFEEGMEPVPLGMSASDAQFLQSRQFSVVEIARWFGVPPHMIGDVSGSTSWGTGIEQQTIGFVTYTESEWINIWESAIDFQLLEDPRFGAKLSTAGLLRGDNKTRWDIYTKAVLAGILSPDEARAFEDLPKRADGLGGEYLTPSGAMLAEQLKEEGNKPDDGSQSPRNE